MSLVESVCRVCLSSGGTQAIDDAHLQETFMKLTKTELASKHGLPENLCRICFSLLQRCHNFSRMARESEQILFDVLTHGTVINNIRKELINQNLSRSDVWLLSTDDPFVLKRDNGYSYITYEETSIKDEMKEEIITKEIFTETYDNIRRKNVKNNDNTENFKCKLCNKNFKYPGHLNRHKRSHITAYICDRCSKTFKHKSAFEAHMRTHTGEKPYTCEVCGKRFNQKSHLKTHKLTHTSLKSFACESCGKSFRQQAQLTSHKRTHTGERPFACNICSMSFGHLTTLRKHKRLHIDIKTFPCSVCPMSFDQECTLTGHMRIHTAERPFACLKCNKTFIEARHLKEHMLSHSRERPYVCERCGKSYKRGEHLKNHVRIGKCKSLNTMK